MTISNFMEKLQIKRTEKKEIEIIEKQEESTPVLNEDKLKSVVNEIKNMKGIRKDIVSDIIYNIEIDNNNNVFINYKYNIFNMV